MGEVTLRQTLLMFLLSLIGAGAVQAQNLTSLSAPDAEVRRWAARSLSSGDRTEQLPVAWTRLETGSLDAFMADAEDYTRVFPSPRGRTAAVVTWSRPPDRVRGPEVTARLSLLDAAGREFGAFVVEPLIAFDVSDDGRFVVAHGERMSGVMQCGALNTHLVFYSGQGNELGRVERGDFSPGYSTALLTDAERFVLGVTGRVIGYDLTTADEAWTLTLPNGDDRPRLVVTPDASGVAVLVTSPSTVARILSVDAAGVLQASVRMDGRVNPGSGLGFEQDLLVVQEIQDDVATYHLLEPRTLRTLRRVRSN